VKELLSRKGVVYAARDITQDEAAMNELVDLGVLSTPVVTIDGEVVVGFNRQKLETLLG
jgi:glutaredoxin